MVSNGSGNGNGNGSNATASAPAVTGGITANRPASSAVGGGLLEVRGSSAKA